MHYQKYLESTSGKKPSGPRNSDCARFEKGTGTAADQRQDVLWKDGSLTDDEVQIIGSLKKYGNGVVQVSLDSAQNKIYMLGQQKAPVDGEAQFVPSKKRSTKDLGNGSPLNSSQAQCQPRIYKSQCRYNFD